MFLSAHLLTGMALGRAVDNSYLAAPIGFVSHYFLDFLPHFEGSSFRDPDDKREGFINLGEKIMVVFDLLFCIFIILFFWRNLSPSMISGGFFAILPDLLDHVPFWKDRVRQIKIFKFLYKKVHKFFHHTTYGGWIVLGIGVDLAVYILSFWYLSK